MNEQELVALEALEKAATPGEWEATPDAERFVWRLIATGKGAAISVPSDIHDVRFIAALRNAAPALFAEVRRLREELAHARTTILEARAFCDAQLGPCTEHDKDGVGCGMEEACPFPDMPWMHEEEATNG